MHEHNDFRDRLISAQQSTPEYREKYERSSRSMLTRQLTPFERGRYVFAAVWSLAGSAVVAWFLAVDKQTSIPFHWGIGFMGLVALAVAITCGIIAATGSINLRRQPKTLAQIAFVGVAVFALSLSFIVPPMAGPLAAIHAIAVCLIALIVITAEVVQAHVDQSELNVREKLLEIELKLAEISETLAKDRS